MALSPEIIESVRERVSIVELVSELVELKPSGRNMLGLCPFHSEKTPSFSVRAEEGYFHCFGCGKSGSVFDFVMETKGLTFVESVHYLANKIGIKIPQNSNWSRSDSDRVNKKKRFLRDLSLVTQSVFCKYLASDPKAAAAREYLRGRGISEDIAKRYFLGYAPAQWEFIAEAVLAEFESRGSKRDEIEAAVTRGLREVGLLKEKKKEGTEGHYDAFRGRMIFPIARSDGAPIAFGGRIVEGGSDAPKYINSPESAIYQKRRTLYGLHQAFAAIRGERHAFLVEGYLDVLSMVQNGFGNTVAACGTAATAEHAGVLKRFVDRITVIFDGDDAGRKAAARCFDVFLNSGVEVYVAMVEAGEDPDSLAQKLSHADLEVYLEERKQSSLEAYLNHLFESRGEDAGSSGAVVRGQIATVFANQLLKVKNLVEREVLLSQGAERIGVSVETLEKHLREREREQPRLSDSLDSRHQSGFQAMPQHVRETWDGEEYSEEPPESPAAAEEQARFPQHVQELVIALILMPRLASRLSEVTAESNTVLERLPAQVRAFVKELIDADVTVSPLSPAAAEQLEDLDTEASNSQLLECLRKHGLDGFGLYESAAHRMQTGGIKVERMFEEAIHAADELSIRSTIEKLRREEQATQDPVELAAIAQQKLIAKRGLDRLQTQGVLRGDAKLK